MLQASDAAGARGGAKQPSVLHPSSKQLEEKCAEDNKGIIQWTAGMYEYVIDFSRMVQLNVNTNRERKVRRRPEQYWTVEMIDAEKKRWVIKASLCI